MLRFLPPVSAVLVACAPPQEPTLPPSEPIAPTVRVSRVPEQAAQGPMIEPVSAADHPFPTPPPGASAEHQDRAAWGRRAVSTAFVELGPAGLLRVVLRNGRVLLLREVTMGPGKFCGVRAGGDAGAGADTDTNIGGDARASPAGTRHCRDYAEVVAAHPVDAPTGGTPVSAGPGTSAAATKPPS